MRGQDGVLIPSWGLDRVTHKSESPLPVDFVQTGQIVNVDITML